MSPFCRAVRQEQDAGRDGHGEHRRGCVAAEFEAAIGHGLIEKIADHRTKGPGEDEPTRYLQDKKENGVSHSAHKSG
jgi:hypothetical protein